MPESADALEQFEQIQQQIDLHLDADILQAFSGEHVSVSMPSGKPTGNDWVMALRCSKPEKIKELIHRGVAQLQKIKQVQAQQLKLVESKDLPGFEEISAATMMVLRREAGVRLPGRLDVHWSRTPRPSRRCLRRRRARASRLKGPRLFRS